MKKYRSGVLFGEELKALYNDAKDNQFALPGFQRHCQTRQKDENTENCSPDSQQPVVIFQQRVLPFWGSLPRCFLRAK